MSSDDLKPSVKWNEEDEKHISFDLLISIPEAYPYVLPQLTIEHPHGILQKQRDDLLLDAIAKCQHLLGSEMIFEIIEFIKVSTISSFIGTCFTFLPVLPC